MEIKHRITEKVLYESKKETIREALIEAVNKGADLQGADLRWADLEGADMQGADLQGADLRGTYLRGAYLQGADLQGANLEWADLQGANLEGAYLFKMKISEKEKEQIIKELQWEIKKSDEV